MHIDINDQEEILETAIEIIVNKAEIAEAAKQVFKVFSEAGVKVESKRKFVQFHLEMFDERVVECCEVLSVKK